jgi:hypothetical protein
MRSLLLFCVLLISVTGFAEETSHKIFAGTFTSAAELSASIAKNSALTKATSTVVPCDAGTQFGVAYILEISKALAKQSKTQTFVEQWSYPIDGEGDGLSEASVTAREITTVFKRRKSNPLFAGSQISETMTTDNNIGLHIFKGDVAYLDHTFRVMGCTQETRAALEAALSEPDKYAMVCTREVKLGTRVKQTICRTQQEIDAERDNAGVYVREARPQ